MGHTMPCYATPCYAILSEIATAQHVNVKSWHWWMKLMQVLHWMLAPVQSAWGGPGMEASLTSPSTFFQRYIALQPGPNNSVRVTLDSRLCDSSARRA